MSTAVHRTLRHLLAVVLLLGLLPAAPATAQDVPNVLVYSGTYGFRHDSIVKGNLTLQQLADSTGAFTVTISEVPADLYAGSLRDYDVVLFNSTTGRFPLTADQQADLERYWGCGGGTIAIHAASDANYGWPAWAELMGAQFDAHPHGATAGDATFAIENAEHPVNTAYADLEEWIHSDELYLWKRAARGTQDVTPLLSLQEETSPAGDSYGPDQALSFVKTFRGQGRVWNNNFGHNQATWDLPEYQQSLVDGIEWVSQVSLDAACFDGDGELPPPPGPPAQTFPTEDDPRESCIAPDGATVLGPDDLPHTSDAGHTPVGAYFDKTTQTVVLDLTGYDHVLYADLSVTHAWPNATDDYDLSITTPWGFDGSADVQPASDPTESDVVEDVVHCAEIRIDVYNHAATSGQAGTVTIDLAEDLPEPPAAGLGLPPVDGNIVVPPGARNLEQQGASFLPPGQVLPEGSTITLTNLDLETHNLVCGADGRADGNCRTVGAAPALGGQLEVQGVADLPPGEYPYFCGLHPSMRGSFTIV